MVLGAWCCSPSKRVVLACARLPVVLAFARLPVVLAFASLPVVLIGVVLMTSPLAAMKPSRQR